MDLAKLSPVPFENLFHLAIVVDDFERAMREVGDEMGVAFDAPRPFRMRMGTPAGDAGEVTVQLVYSRNGPPYLELIQAMEPAGVWTPAHGPRFHHIGVWSDDLAGEAARLERLGMTKEAWGIGLDGQVATFAYLRDAHGLRVELVDSRGRASLAGR